MAAAELREKKWEDRAGGLGRRQKLLRMRSVHSGSDHDSSKKIKMNPCQVDFRPPADKITDGEKAKRTARQAGMSSSSQYIEDVSEPVEGGAALPEGWRKVPSRSRPGEFSYENIATGVRVAYVPSLPPVSESSSRGATNPNANQKQLSVAERQELSKRRQQRCCLIS